jgi:formylglycine-generating enzyme required for sulfatase activity
MTKSMAPAPAIRERVTQALREWDAARVPMPVTVPAGSFWMGADDADDRFASPLEKPRHEVVIARPFGIGRTPVTFDEWDAYAADAGAYLPPDRGWGRGRNPVVGVSWDDASAYAQWLAARAGRAYRLPSEAEWEYCCRAGTRTVFQTGSDISVDQANYLYTDFRERPGLGRLVEAGSYPPNAFGLFDMHGNVCELVEDAWHDHYEGAPLDGSAWAAPQADRPWRVVRGGGWDAMPRLLRCAYRDWIHRGQRLDNVGFRVACDVR